MLHVQTFMISTASSSLVDAVGLQVLAQCQKCRIMSSAQLPLCWPCLSISQAKWIKSAASNKTPS